MAKRKNKSNNYRNFGKALIITGIVFTFLSPLVGAGIAAVGLLLMYHPPGTK